MPSRHGIISPGQRMTHCYAAEGVQGYLPRLRTACVDGLSLGDRSGRLKIPQSGCFLTKLRVYLLYKRCLMLHKFWDSKTARVLCTALIFAAALAFLYGARETLTLFLFAILFAL